MIRRTRSSTNDNHQSEPKDLHLCRGGKPYGDLRRASPQFCRPPSVGLHHTSCRGAWEPGPAAAVHAVGLDGFSDPVPALRALRSGAHCLIGGFLDPRRLSSSAPLTGRHRQRIEMLRKFLLASDFDQTLSFNDSGVVLSELIGFHSFHDKVAGLADMMHVNQYDGLTIAGSEAKFITRVARRTVLSANAMSVLVPVLEKVMNWDSAKIRRFFASYGLTLLNGRRCARTYSLSRTLPC